MFSKKKRAEKKEKNPLALQTKVSRMLELPGSLFPGLAQIEISGNSEAVVDGCRSIVEYDEHTIKLHTGKLCLTFRGNRLRLRSMNDSLVVVEGWITSLEFSQT